MHIKTYSLQRFSFAVRSRFTPLLRAPLSTYSFLALLFTRATPPSTASSSQTISRTIAEAAIIYELHMPPKFRTCTFQVILPATTLEDHEREVNAGPA